MKNLLISLVLALVLGTSASASADVEIETKTNVVEVIIKGSTPRGGWTKKVTFSKPSTTAIKPCVDHPRTYACVYLVHRNGKEEEMTAFRTDRGYVQPIYSYQHPIVASR
jgi:hypothetical protein